MFTDLTKMPPPKTLQDNSSSSGEFGRQDSLDVAASLQERDRTTQMGDFMETQLDFANYMRCFDQLGVPHDPFLGTSQYEFPQQMPIENDIHHSPKEPETKKQVVSAPVKEVKRRQQVNSDDWDESSSASSSEDSSYSTRPKRNNQNKAKKLLEYKPQTVARSYKLKDKEEKAEPMYKFKRARNNDAVRKCRARAKEEKRMKDREGDKMRARIEELESLLAAEKSARQKDQETIKILLENRKGQS